MPVVTQSGDCRHVRVELGARSYEIVVGQNLLGEIASAIEEWINKRSLEIKNPSACLITDTNVAHYAHQVEQALNNAGWRTTTFELTPGEPSKRIAVVTEAWEHLVHFPADRQTVVIAVGGGVVGDAAGFVAATFARGLPFVQIPTTLLSDVDSSVGGKVGINLPLAKNLVGAFHQPLGVMIDTSVLETLPEREYRAGLAEVVKYGAILDAGFFEFLERNTAEINAHDAAVLQYIISRSCELKAEVVEKDEYETSGLRAILNYGHTFAHAFEALAGYGELLHGEAVSIGMVFASRLSAQLGRIDPALTDRLIALLQSLNLMTSLPESVQLRAADVLDTMLLDKKSVGGKLRFVLASELGRVELVSGVPIAAVEAVLNEGGIAS